METYDNGHINSAGIPVSFKWSPQARMDLKKHCYWFTEMELLKAVCPS